MIIIARNVKCQKCNKLDTPKDEMEFELVGKTKQTKKYYHKSCYVEHLKDKQFKEEERVRLDSLVLVIQKIYGIEQLPHQVYPFLQKLRNGEQVFGNQQTGKRYKMGYPYEIIEESYLYCEDTLNYWNSQKDFGGFMNAFKYGIAIIIDKLYIVEQKVKDKESKEALANKHSESISNESPLYEKSYKKKNNDSSLDLSNFLDD